MVLKDTIVRIVKSYDIDTIFTLPAYYITGLTASLKESGIKTIELRNEYNASFAALGYSLMSKKVGILCVNTGPSFTNALTAIKTLKKEGIPILVMVGVQEKQINADETFFQTINITNTYAEKVYDLNSENYVLLQEVIDLLIADYQGPIIVKIPIDQLSKEVDWEFKSTVVRSIKSDNTIPSKVAMLKNKILLYQKPLFVFGRGMKPSDCLLTDFKYNFVTTILAKEHGINSNNERYLGTIGILGDSMANDALKSCDLLICVGARLSERTILNDNLILKNKHIVYINTTDNICCYDGTTFELIKCDARKFIEYFVSRHLHTTKTPLMHLVKEKNSSFVVNDLSLTTESAMRIVFHSSLANSVFCLDDGMYTLSALKFYMNSKIVFFGSMAPGGSAVGSAIGSHFANSGRRTIVIIGDRVGFRRLITNHLELLTFHLSLRVFL